MAACIKDWPQLVRRVHECVSLFPSVYLDVALTT